MRQKLITVLRIIGRAILAVMVVFVALVVASLAYSSTTPDRQIARIRRQIVATFPPGTGHEQVLSYLRHHHMSDWGYLPCRGTAWGNEYHSCEDVGLIQTLVKGGPDLWPLFTTGDIEVSFFFDRQGRLSHYGFYPAHVYL